MANLLPCFKKNIEVTSARGLEPETSVSYTGAASNKQQAAAYVQWRIADCLTIYNCRIIPPACYFLYVYGSLQVFATLNTFRKIQKEQLRKCEQNLKFPTDCEDFVDISNNKNKNYEGILTSVYFFMKVLYFENGQPFSVFLNTFSAT